MTKRMLELFSGTQVMSSTFKDHGWETLTVDNNEAYADETDMNMDILDVTPDMVIDMLGGKPDVIWASPPCTKFSVAAVYRHWEQISETEFKPKTEETEKARDIVIHTLWLIDELQPEYWYLENPRGMLRKMDFMLDLPRYTVTYCQYGEDRMKPTDIFTNHPEPDFKPMCKNGDPCHKSAPRGSRTNGVQGQKNAKVRSMIPFELCKHIYSISE